MKPFIITTFLGVYENTDVNGGLERVSAQPSG